MRLPVDEREVGSQHRPVTRAFQQNTKGPVQTNNYDEDVSSELEYDEVYLPRPIELDWDKLRIDPELSRVLEYWWEVDSTETPETAYVERSGATPWRYVSLVQIWPLLLKLLESSKIYFDEDIKTV